MSSVLEIGQLKRSPLDSVSQLLIRSPSRHYLTIVWISAEYKTKIGLHHQYVECNCHTINLNVNHRRGFPVNHYLASKM